MARARMVSKDVLNSPELFDQPYWAAVLWVGLITNADDDGLVRSDVGWLRVRCLSRQRPIRVPSVRDVCLVVARWVSRGVLTSVDKGGVSHYRLTSFRKYNRLRRPGGEERRDEERRDDDDDARVRDLGEVGPDPSEILPEQLDQGNTEPGSDSIVPILNAEGRPVGPDTPPGAPVYAEPQNPGDVLERLMTKPYAFSLVKAQLLAEVLTVADLDVWDAMPDRPEYRSLDAVRNRLIQAGHRRPPEPRKASMSSGTAAALEGFRKRRQADGQS